ncbi:hypothetical protein BO99DRAFT_407855 [Aspergillus violaceofuscus CBS 115571]|uniref:Secreted protein n=1 Tax=Aspergillus violaceofuscus (strain CBS 115571) TaxID=1450538 RepID=A0A2V5GVB7_ASPV1|nr:hypothetical protein BO99DRAFT_407855 [Aspergillus violaceofuscus CBS 115571]
MGPGRIVCFLFRFYLAFSQFPFCSSLSPQPRIFQRGLASSSQNGLLFPSFENQPSDLHRQINSLLAVMNRWVLVTSTLFPSI